MNRFLLTDFNKDTLEAFFEFSELEGEKTISLSTLGGSTSGCAIILDIINKSPEDYKIEVSGCCYSSGFILALLTTCSIIDISKQYLIPTTYMYHCTQLEGLGWSKEEKKAIIQSDYKSYQKIKHVLTHKQIRKIEWFHFLRSKLWLVGKLFNDDTYLNYDQMKLLLGDRFEIRQG